MNVVALLAHPDDELMCAGLLARMVTEGHQVELCTVFMDDREPEWAAAVEALGVTTPRVRYLDDEDLFVWSRWSVRTLERDVPPADLLISHRAEDANTSHGHLGRVARTLARKNRATLLEVDQAFPGGFDPDCPPPNLLVDVSAHYEAKRAAVTAYGSVLSGYPGLADALEARDRANGWQIGVAHAEAYRIHKAVW